ncbi:MAG: hypothetical protein Tsb005_10910 [Gammaproteobacteria bacterium]
MQFKFYKLMTYSICILLWVLDANASNAKNNSVKFLSERSTSAFTALLRDAEQTVHIGIKVVDVDSNQVIYQRNARRLFTPASTLKIFTAAEALVYLGPDYRFETQLIADSNNINEDKLRGNLYLQLSGDPSLSIDNLRNLLVSLQQAGIKQIQGDFIIDSTTATTAPYPPGAMIDDKVYGYGAPVAPLLLDNNRYVLIIAPGKQIGHPANIADINIYPLLKIHNRLQTAKADAQDCQVEFRLDQVNQLIVEGCIPLNTAAFSQELAIQFPQAYARYVIKNLLQQLHIKLLGDVKFTNHPHKNALFIGSHQSEPLLNLITHMLKESDNSYADSLFLKIGANYFNHTPSWQKASKALIAIMRNEFALDLTQATIVDGSGVSRYDLVSPAQAMQLLLAMVQHFPLRYEFINALPLAGKDGTLEWRMREQPAYTRVRAKTGNMTGVSALAGYVETRRKHMLAFVIMMQGFPDHGKNYRQLEDKLCNFMVENW